MNPLNPLTWFTSIGPALEKWYESAVKQILDLLLVASLPSQDKIVKGFFSWTLGGTFGLSVRVVSIVAILLAFLFVLTPLRDHSRGIGGLLASFLGLIAFQYLFYPLYSLIYVLMQGVTQGVLNLATGQKGGTAQAVNALLTSMPGGSSDLVIAILFAYLFAFFTLIEVVGLQVLLFGLLALYPLLLAIQAINSTTRVIFSGATTAIVVVLVSPPLMAIGFALPLLIRDVIPGAGIPGIASTLSILGGLFAMATPLVISYFVFRKVNEVVGRLDASLSNSVSVDTIPPVSIEETRRDISETHAAPLMEMAGLDVLGDNLLNSDDLLGDMKKTVINGVASASAAAGHPYIGFGIKGASAFFDKMKQHNDPSASPPEPSPTAGPGAGDNVPPPQGGA